MADQEQKKEIQPQNEPFYDRLRELGVVGMVAGSKTETEKERSSLSTLLNALPEEERKNLVGADTSSLEKFVNTSDKPYENLQKFQSVRKSAKDQKVEDLRYAKEDRLARQFQLENMKYYGATVTTEDISDIRKRTGNDLNVIIETYGLDAEIDPETGDRSYVIPPADVLKNKATALTLKESELSYLGTIVDAKDTMSEVLKTVQELGLNNINKVGNILWEDMGPFSMPARFDLVGQYAKNPKYTSLKSKLERAFQLYRKAITGAQASDKELKMLRPLIASFKQRPEVFQAVAQDLISESSRLYERRLGLYQRAGRDITPLVGYIQKVPLTSDGSRQISGPAKVSSSPGGRSVTSPSGRVITIKGR